MTQKMKTFFIYLLTCTAIGWGCWVSDTFAFLNILPLVWVIGGTIILSLLTRPVEGSKRVMTVFAYFIFRKVKKTEGIEIEGFYDLGSYAVKLGFIGMILGMFLLCLKLPSMTMVQIGKQVALSYTAMLIGFAFYHLVIVPLVANLGKKK